MDALDASFEWFPIRAAAGKEHAACGDIQSMGIDCIVPMHKKYRRLPKHRARKEGRSRELIITNVIPGYIFVRSDNPNIVFRTKEFSRFAIGPVMIGNKVSIPRRGEVGEFLDRCAEGAYDEDSTPEMAETQSMARKLDELLGCAVFLTDGPMAGLGGIVDSHDGNKVTVDVDIFGRPTPVEVEHGKLKLAS